MTFPTTPDFRGMALIPAGEFPMGSNTGSEAERPTHRVYVDRFYLDTQLVSNDDFRGFVEATGYVTTAEAKSAARTWRTFCSETRMDHPVILVSWHDAAAFAGWAGKRLPTEAEWEKAARGGLEDALFPWGDEPPAARRVNWQRNSNASEPPPTAPVSRSAPNGFGLSDMSGNVWQWCQDWYEERYYEVSPAHDPAGPGSGQFRVRRGGAWNVRESFRLRCANRGAMDPEAYWPNLGFRCAAPAGEL